MPIRFVVRPDVGLVLATFQDAVDWAREVTSVRHALVESPGFDRDFDVIYDFRPMATTTAHAAEMASLAERPVMSLESRRAVLFRTPEQLAIARMFAAVSHTAGYAAHVTADPQDACGWLEIPVSPSELGLLGEG